MKKSFIRHQQMRNDTLAEVLSAIRHGASCKREVQSQTGLSWGKVSETVNLLLEKQIIDFSDECAKDTAGAGRRSSYFDFSQTDFLCMGMELQRQRITTVLTSLSGKLLGCTVIPLKTGLNTRNLHDNVRKAFRCQLEQSGIVEGKVIALSFSLTGAVDGGNKIWMKSSHLPDIKNYDFNTIAAAFPHLLYFSIEHDITARACSVLRHEKWNDENFVFMHVGGGVGMAIHNQNGFFHGSRGLAGEVGHIPIMNPPAGSRVRQCSCGQNNCLETFLSDHGLLTFAKDKFGIEANDLLSLFAVATEAQMNAFYCYLHPYLLHMGITAANLFDPATLIIGGEVLEPWLPRIETELLAQIQSTGWINSPGRLKCYHMTSCNSAFGAADNAIDPVIAQMATAFHIF